MCPSPLRVSTASVRLRRPTQSNKPRPADSHLEPRRAPNALERPHDRPIHRPESFPLCQASICWWEQHRDSATTRPNSRISVPWAFACRRSGEGARRATAPGRKQNSMIGWDALPRTQTRSTKSPRPWSRPARGCLGSARTSHPRSTVYDRLQSLRYRVDMLRRPASGESVE